MTATPPSSAAARRRRIVPVAVTLVLVGTVALGAFLTARARTGARTIYVAVFENKTGDSTLDPLGTMAADWVARGLVAAGDVQVLSPGWIGAEAGTSDRAAARAAARSARARTFVAGVYYRDGDRLRFDAQVVDARSGRLLQALAPITVPTDSVSVGVELLRQRITGALAARLAPRELLEITARAQPPLFDAYENYVEGVQLFSRYQGEEAARRFAAAWTLDTTFHLAALYDVLVSYNRGDTRRGDSIVGYLTPRRERMAAFDRALLTVFENERAADVEGVLRGMRRVATMAPGSQFSVGHAVAAIAANEPREALAVLLQLDPTTGLLRDNARYWDWRTTARHLLTDHRRELQDAVTARARHSDRRAHIAHEIRARAALGQVAEVADLLQRGLALPGGGPSAAPELLRTAAAELRAHGHADAAAEISERVVEWYRTRPIDEQQGQLRAHAQALYDAGRYEEAQALLATLPADEAGMAALGLRGVIAARLGAATEARRIADVLATPAQTRRRGANLIWSARIAAVLGEDDLAVQLLSDALAAGATHGLWLHTDADLAPLRRHPAFRRLVR